MVRLDSAANVATLGVERAAASQRWKTRFWRFKKYSLLRELRHNSAAIASSLPTVRCASVLVVEYSCNGEFLPRMLTTKTTTGRREALLASVNSSGVVYRNATSTTIVETRTARRDRYAGRAPLRCRTYSHRHAAVHYSRTKPRTCRLP